MTYLKQVLGSSARRTGRCDAKPLAPCHSSLTCAIDSADPDADLERAGVGVWIQRWTPGRSVPKSTSTCAFVQGVQADSEIRYCIKMNNLICRGEWRNKRHHLPNRYITDHPSLSTGPVPDHSASHPTNNTSFILLLPSSAHLQILQAFCTINLIVLFIFLCVDYLYIIFISPPQFYFYHLLFLCIFSSWLYVSLICLATTCTKEIPCTFLPDQ